MEGALQGKMTYHWNHNVVTQAMANMAQPQKQQDFKL